MVDYTSEKKTKLFISHSYKDRTYVKMIVSLFQQIGLSPNDMFCSSIPGYNIPLNTNIYDYLRHQFNDYNLWVIFILSENYYNSPACLIEMGAAWVLHNMYTCVLLPQFEYKDIKGAIDQLRISIKLDSDSVELKTRLNELRDLLCKEFSISQLNSSLNIWEQQRDEFIERINSSEMYWKMVEEYQKNNTPLDEWISPLKAIIRINPECYDAMFILGGIFFKTNRITESKELFNKVAAATNNSDLRNKALQMLNNTKD